MTPFPNAPSQPKSRRGGCCLFGCLFPLIFLAIVVIGGGYWAYRLVNNAFDKYTSASAEPVPPYTSNPDVEEAAITSLNRLSEAFDDGATEHKVSIPMAQLNSIINVSPSFQSIKDGLALGTDGNDMSMQFSLQLKKIEEWMTIPNLFGPFSERYINGSLKGTAVVYHTTPTITLTSVSLNGNVVPVERTKEIAGFMQGILKSILDAAVKDKNEELHVLVTRMERLELNGTGVTLETKAAGE